MLHSRGVYLQPSESGQSVSAGMHRHKILAEVADTGFIHQWRSLYERRLVRHFKKPGLRSSEAKSASRDWISRIGEMWRIRRAEREGQPKADD